MIGMQTQYNQFYVGYYFGKGQPVVQGAGLYFKYEQLTDKELKYHQLVSNLIATDGGVVIRTSWNMNFQVQGKILLQDGSVHLISRVQEQTAINPQVNAIVKNTNKLYYLELV
jgi:hypothetical protein